MTIEIYGQDKIQQDSGAIHRDWDYDNPLKIVDCQAQGIADGGIRVVGSTERWGDRYSDVEWVHISMQYVVNKGDRVGNIKNKAGQEIFPGLVFDVLGKTSILDGFGNLLEFDVLAQGVERK